MSTTKLKLKLNLIRNSKLIYPQAVEDHELLTKLGAPFRCITPDYMPVFNGWLPKGVKVKITELSVLEAAMLKRLKARFDHDAEINERNIVLSYPKNADEAHIEKAVCALRVWYRPHFIILTPNVKRSGKLVKTVLEKNLVVEV